MKVIINEILCGNALDVLKTLPDKSIDCCVTSPPYYGLRSYLPDDDPNKRYEVGMDETPFQYIDRLVEIFREVRRVLKDDGTFWLNIADSYAGSNQGSGVEYAKGKQATNKGTNFMNSKNHKSKLAKVEGFKRKELMMIPARLAIALSADGWYLRSDIIWCLSGGTWLYVKTPKGVMPMMIKDMVRLKSDTLKLWNGSKWTKVLGFGRSNDDSDKIQMTLQSGERIQCTGNHVFPTNNGNKNASDLAVGDVILSCELPDSDIETPNYLTADILWFIGVYMADGSRSGKVIQISGNIDEMERLERIQKLSQQIECSVTHKVDGNKLDIRVYGKVINAILRQYIWGNNAHNKCFTTALWKLKNTALKNVMEGYLHGDGHFDKANNRYRFGFCRNKNLERDMRTLAARLGAKITLSLSHSKCNGKAFPSFDGEWKWESSGHINEKSKFEIVSICKSKSKSFWDIAVEDEPHLFSLASGVLTHNCKPNAMPSSVRDRCTTAHEYIYMFSKQPKYYFDADAIKEPAKYAGDNRGARTDNRRGTMCNSVSGVTGEFRNKRSVWSVNTKPSKEAHFAQYPPNLITPCILAGCPKGGIVLDPFFGSGTTGLVAKQNNRDYVGIDLNEEYCRLAAARIEKAMVQ